MICLAVLLLAAHHAQGTEEAESHLLAAAGGEQGQRRKVSWVPVPTVVYRSLTPEEEEAAAASEPFATCAACRCCPTSDQSSCVQTQCCFGIKCNIPGKPFGACSFSPNKCGCGPNNCSSSGSPSRLTYQGTLI